jgi:DNA-binding NarL/FixJ family response regulator
MRYLIVDDHILVREGIAQIIREKLHEDTLHIDQASTSVEATVLLAKWKYDLALLDITMEGRSGLDLLSQISNDYPELPTLIVSMHPEDQYALRTFKLGAAGYLTKFAAATDLVTAIKDIFTTGRYISTKVSLILADECRLKKTKVSATHHLLSNREIEVACLIARGMTSIEIGNHLNLSYKTVNTYRSRLLTKLSIRNNSDITSYCISNNLTAA